MILLCVACLAVGFFIGRQSFVVRTEIKYVQGDVVRDTVFEPVPVLEIVHDTILLVEYDTVRTLIDWNTERYYAERLLDDPLRGLLDVSATVQFNRLQDLSFSFIPIYKEVTKYKVATWQPYVATSFNTFNQASVGAGIFYKKTGVEFQYITDFNRRLKGYGIGFKYKF